MADTELARTETIGDASPDIMNDPAYATNNGGGEDGTGEADTCRICRGEGGDTEPLFHPCKCSGSIKYVHQDCLMEWLSHSQKKHCELCKTPFRFTKLYSPNMPQSLPLPVLMRHVAIHIAKNLATWLRACLVVIVWLACLPYIIRQVWRLLFWFSDGGWPPGYARVDSLRNSSSLEASLEAARELQYASLPANGTSPVTPFQPAPTTSASVGGLIERLFAFFSPLNISASDPLAVGFVKTISYGLGIQSLNLPEDQADNITQSVNLRKLNGLSAPSLLSEVTFLKNLTRNATLNDAIINIVEGYIITILVVVCFILVFLIREWVVQQQPGMNMGNGFNADFAPNERAEGRQRRNAAPRAREDQEQAPPQAVPVAPAGERPIARPRRRHIHVPGADERPPQPPLHDAREAPAAPTHGDRDVSPTSGRPTAPRDALSPAFEIQRRLTEEPRHTEEFLAIWRRADSDPQEVLRIIERENKSDDMRYWVNAMNVLQNPVPRSNGLPSPPANNDPVPDSLITQTSESANKNAAVLVENDGSSASSGSWVDVPQTSEAPPIVLNQGEGSADNVPSNKGKGRATEEQDDSSSVFPQLESRSANPRSDSRFAPSFSRPPSFVESKPTNPRSDSIFAQSSSRPRATSDGPQLKENKSPLANNNWTFSNLSGDDLPGPESLPAGENNQTDEEDSDIDMDEPLVPLKSLLAPETQRELDFSAPNPQPQDPPGYQELDSDSEAEEQEEALEANPFHPDTPLPEPQPPLLQPENPPAVGLQDRPDAPPAAPRGVFENLADFLWGGVGDAPQNDLGENDERIVHDVAAEAPFIPVAHEDAFDQPDPAPEPDREVVEAAIAAGIDPNDQDAIDDAEDFEGIMELVGMRGPIFSLVQNALFSAFLLALTVGVGVWIPYNIGRVSLLMVAHPGSALKVPLRIVYGCAAFLQDMSLAVLGMISYVLITACSWVLGSFSSVADHTDRGMGAAAMNLSSNSAERMMNGTLNGLLHITDSEIFAFSAASHESLIVLKNGVIDFVAGIGASVLYLFTGNYNLSWDGFSTAVLSWLKYGWSLLAALPGLFARPDSWVISLEPPKRDVPLDLGLSVWDGWDRFWAIFGGYVALCILGMLYVRKGSPFSTGQQGREWEAVVIDSLNQAGGVMKVILIISIEMLVFPLYCGLLLDAALLPLFDNATITSRILFTAKSPFTSLFVHWFVGTCYMFHFALFVSMCRKIMRKGVLYFIRDPDDPTFHPVRDVLERNVATQLRKIMFSALVYGALVVICLGGVVWGLALAFKGVLPIHWSSNEPVLEFPIDLLFYNFLMPMAVRFFKPSDGLHTMYRWWFRQCARMLRLTWFMFDERQLDEEGYHVRRYWTDIFRGVKGDFVHPLPPQKAKNRNRPFEADPELRAYFQKDGKYVRAPASDQVRIPKGVRIFLEVDMQNERVDGKKDRSDGIHGKNSDLYKQVYIPPFFRFRICLFILFIWLFAAATGVGITIVPLVFGRHIFGKIIPPHVRKNDVYAFSIGIYILGSALYAILNLHKFIKYLRTSLAINGETPHNVLRRFTKIAGYIFSIAWTYSAFLFILPTLFAFVVEFYFILPLHTYFSIDEPHVVHFVQSWTLGLLYVKLTTRIILWHDTSRPAQSLRAITRNGYLNPDARLATRAFILPGIFALSFALAYPWLLAKLMVSTLLSEQPERQFLAYRYAYPMCLALSLVCVAAWRLLGMWKKWRMMIRDEVYLIGERLHNFGDRKGSASGNALGVRRLET